MARAPRGGSWAAEYRHRLAENRGLPTPVARGHGSIPAKIARGVEGQIAGKPRALPVKTQIRYRRGIGEYEKAWHGGLKTGHTVNLTFPSERAARRYVVTTLTMTPDADEYVEIDGSGTEWTVTLLR